MRNDPSDPYQRVTIVDRGETLRTRATLVACVHGAMRGGDGYATFLAIKFTFEPMYNYRRARLARIALLFTSEGLDPEVVDIRPNGIFQNTTVDVVESSMGASLGVKLGGVSAGVEAIWERPRGEIHGHLTTQGSKASPNVSQWTIQENAQRKTGIPSSLIAMILLRRTDNGIFSMVPKIDVKYNGLSLSEALAPRTPMVDPVIFHPTLDPMIGGARLPYNLTDINQNDLEEFWHSQVLQTDISVFIPQDILPSTAMASDESATKIMYRTGAKEASVGSEENLSKFKEAIEKGIYTDLWNISDTDPAATRGFNLRYEWKDFGDAPDGVNLSEYFSWLKDDLELPDLSNTNGEQQNIQTYVTENVPTEAQSRPVQIPESTHTLCSMLIRKAKSRTSFKSFEDLGRELFDEKTIESVADFFAMDTKDYNGFRKLDFGSCEILPTGEGNELSIFYIIQTPYYSSGFWSMFLVGKADPKNPARARKLSGLIQSGADVDLEEILDRTALEAEKFSYHPLLLPYHLYVNHYENTSKQFDIVLKKVESAELRIMDALQNRKDSTYQGGDNYDLEPNHWGLANLSKSLHEASMEIAEVARRRQFEDSLADALKKELSERRSAQNQMFRDLSRYHRWANSHQLDIEGMPGRIDSLKNLLYSMIAQQDNVVSIKLAREGLSDSKAMKTLSIMTILFLPGTFVATLFTTDVVSFQDSDAEVRAYIKVVVPLTVGLMILYGVWLWKAPEWSRSRHRMRDLEAGNMKMFHRNSFASSKVTKQS